MKVNLKRDYFAAGRRFRVRNNPNILPEGVPPPSDADILDDKDVVVEKKPDARIDEQVRLSAKPKK